MRLVIIMPICASDVFIHNFHMAYCTAVPASLLCNRLITSLDTISICRPSGKLLFRLDQTEDLTRNHGYDIYLRRHEACLLFRNYHIHFGYSKKIRASVLQLRYGIDVFWLMYVSMLCNLIFEAETSLAGFGRIKIYKLASS